MIQNLKRWVHMFSKQMKKVAFRMNLGYFPMTIEVLNGTIFLLISRTLDSGRIDHHILEK